MTARMLANILQTAARLFLLPDAALWGRRLRDVPSAQFASTMCTSVNTGGCWPRETLHVVREDRSVINSLHQDGLIPAEP